jgi:sarcosine oxidase gamma subunit
MPQEFERELSASFGMDESERKTLGEMLQACSSSVRPTVGAPQLIAKVRRGRPGRIDSGASRQLNSDRSVAPPDMGKEWAVVQQAIAGNADAQEHLFACLAPDFLDTELSVFMQQLRVQGAAGEPGRA